MLNFTRQERVVIYFLVITLGLGAILRLIRNAKLETDLTPLRFYQEEADFKEVAAAINSGSTVFIDSLDSMASDMPAGATPTEAETDINAIINLNTAGISELTTLPGVGPALAQRIRAYTEQHGPFKNKTDIVLVKGIGPKLYARIEGLVTTD